MMKNNNVLRVILTIGTALGVCHAQADSLGGYIAQPIPFYNDPLYLYLQSKQQNVESISAGYLPYSESSNIESTVLVSDLPNSDSKSSGDAQNLNGKIIMAEFSDGKKMIFDYTKGGVAKLTTVCLGGLFASIEVKVKITESRLTYQETKFRETTYGQGWCDIEAVAGTSYNYKVVKGKFIFNDDLSEKWSSIESIMSLKKINLVGNMKETDLLRPNTKSQGPRENLAGKVIMAEFSDGKKMVFDYTQAGVAKLTTICHGGLYASVDVQVDITKTRLTYKETKARKTSANGRWCTIEAVANTSYSYKALEGKFIFDNDSSEPWFITDIH